MLVLLRKLMFWLLTNVSLPYFLECDPQQEFCCKDGEGIDFDWKCDGENDCMDGEDEAQCSNSEVLAY